MTKSQYLNICMGQPTDWLELCAANPSFGMKPIHIAIVRIAIRRKIA